MSAERLLPAAMRLDAEYLTAREIGALLRCSDDYAASLLKSGRIRGVNLGGGLGWRAHRDDVEAFVRGRVAAQGARPAGRTSKAAK